MRRGGLGATAVQALLRTGAMLAIAGAVAVFAALPQVRWQLDATRLRAFALGPATLALLDRLEGSWSITVVAADSSIDATTRAQIEEVLRRITEANPRVRTSRIDPSDPASMAAWEQLVDEVQRSAGGDPETLARLRGVLDEGERAFARLVDFAAAQLPAIDALPEGDDAAQRERALLRDTLAELLARAAEFAEALVQLRTTSPEQPLPDDDGARLLLAANHAAWAERLADASSLLARWAAAPALPEPLRAWAARAAPAFEQEALALRGVEDRLARQPSIPLSAIGRQLASGEAAIVIGPSGTVVVPSWQLLPAQPRDEAGGAGGAGRGDRRFRGEQVLAGAIRSLLAPPPLVVVVHGEERSLLRAAADGGDLAAASDLLRAARLEVREWGPGEPAAPSLQGRATVWIVVPPLTRRGTETSATERLLVDRARRLVDDGQPVLITLGRSLLPLFRQSDPWAQLVAPLGARVETGTIVLDLDRIGPGRGVVRSWQRIEPPSVDHPIARALAGQALTVAHAMPMSIEAPDGGSGVVLASIDPGERRWLENDWRQELRERSAPPEGRSLPGPLPVAAAIERSLAEPGRRQRAVVVASGGWLLSSVLDAAEPLGGGRTIPANPGNRELLLASTLWLAGLDEQIAPGAGGAAGARLSGIDGSIRLAWTAIGVGVLPLGALALGVLAAVSRRRG